MTSLSQYLTEEHTACDDFFVAAENAVAASDWGAAKQAFTQFQTRMHQHFAREEEVLFPAFETLTGMTGGPTWVMRGEHQQMNGLMESMAIAIGQRDQNAFLGQSETLLMLMRQHNMKEENILYPMAENALAGDQSELMERMATV